MRCTDERIQMKSNSFERVTTLNQAMAIELALLVKLADNGSFYLRDYGNSRSSPKFRWQACCRFQDQHAHNCAASPGVAIRKLLAAVRKASISKLSEQLS